MLTSWRGHPKGSFEATGTKSFEQSHEYFWNSSSLKQRITCDPCRKVKQLIFCSLLDQRSPNPSTLKNLFNYVCDQHSLFCMMIFQDDQYKNIAACISQVSIYEQTSVMTATYQSLIPCFFPCQFSRKQRNEIKPIAHRIAPPTDVVIKVKYLKGKLRPGIIVADKKSASSVDTWRAVTILVYTASLTHHHHTQENRQHVPPYGDPRTIYPQHTFENKTPYSTVHYSNLPPWWGEMSPSSRILGARLGVEKRGEERTDDRAKMMKIE